MRIAAFAIVAATMALGAPAARAGGNPALAKAKKLLDELRYEQAAKTLEAALEAGDGAAADMVQVYQLLGQVSASLGKSDAAVEAFEHALALDPDLELGEGLSPRITRPFDAARSFFDEHEPLSVSHELEDDPRLLILVVDSDPLHMVAGGRATFWTESGRSVEVLGEGSSRVELAVPEGAVSFTAAVIDNRNNRLVEIGSPDDRVKLSEPEVEVPPPHEGGGDTEPGRAPIYARWWLWGGLSAGFAAAAAGFGVSAHGTVRDIQERVDDSGRFEYAEVQALEKRARRRALWTNISWGAAGACAAAAVYLLLDDDGDSSPEKHRAGAAIAPVVTGDALGFSATVRFH